MPRTGLRAGAPRRTVAIPIISSGAVHAVRTCPPRRGARPRRLHRSDGSAAVAAGGPTPERSAAGRARRLPQVRRPRHEQQPGRAVGRDLGRRAARRVARAARGARWRPVLAPARAGPGVRPAAAPAARRQPGARRRVRGVRRRRRPRGRGDDHLHAARAGRRAAHEQRRDLGRRRARRAHRHRRVGDAPQRARGRPLRPRARAGADAGHGDARAATDVRVGGARGQRRAPGELGPHRGHDALRGAGRPTTTGGRRGAVDRRAGGARGAAERRGASSRASAAPASSSTRRRTCSRSASR
jgi:hypothetical protein